ncbi:hypothetical protein CEXT_234801 [Caerostris extrusa]|uniref:Uncharacterized protein n=1 Tax=Caerostris extrusa TaxID=172846 RepID=A0AAV4QMK5_CAEEX|nr:hypothetical protein CEXT_234801 [Caerostris extrusa]
MHLRLPISRMNGMGNRWRRLPQPFDACTCSYLRKYIRHKGMVWETSMEETATASLGYAVISSWWRLPQPFWMPALAVT